MSFWKQGPGRMLAATATATVLGLSGLVSDVALADEPETTDTEVAATTEGADAATVEQLSEPQQDARAVDGKVDATLKLSSTTTAGVYPNPQLGQVPVNGGGGQYQLKVSSVGTGATDATIRIPLDEGFYWDQAEINKLAYSGSAWSYNLSVSWDGDTLVLTFPRINEGANVYFQLPFYTVQTEGAQTGDVMSPPVATITDGSGTHTATADKGVTVVSVPRAQLTKSVSAGSDATEMKNFSGTNKLATAFVSTISVGGVATEVGGRPASLGEALTVSDTWAVTPAGTQVIHELDCVSYAAGSGCLPVAQVPGNVTANLGSGSGTVTFSGFPQIPAVGTSVTSVQIKHWVPVETEHEMVPEKTTFANTVKSQNWTSDGTPLKELTANGSATKNPWEEPVTPPAGATYTGGGWLKGMQEFVDQSADPLVIPSDIGTFWNSADATNNLYGGPAWYQGAACRGGWSGNGFKVTNLRTTYAMAGGGQYGPGVPTWTDSQSGPYGCDEVTWSPGSKYVSTLTYSPPSYTADGVTERFGIPEQPFLYDFWNPTEQRIVVGTDIFAAAGDLVSAPTTAATTDNRRNPAAFRIQYGTGANCTKPADNSRMADPADALTWHDSIDTAGGANAVCGVRVQMLEGEEIYLQSNNTNGRKAAFMVSIPFELLQQPKANGGVSAKVYDYMAGTEGNGELLVSDGPLDAPKRANRNGTGGALAWILAGDYYFLNSAPKEDNCEAQGGEKCNKALVHSGDWANYRFTPDVTQYPGLDDHYTTSGIEMSVKVPGPVLAVAPTNPDGWYSVVTANPDGGYTIVWKQTKPIDVPADFNYSGTTKTHKLPDFDFEVNYPLAGNAATPNITSEIKDGARAGYSAIGAVNKATIPVEIKEPVTFVMTKAAAGAGEIKPGETASWELAWYNGAGPKTNVVLEDVLPRVGDGRGSTTGGRLVDWTLDGDVAKDQVKYQATSGGPWIQLPDPGTALEAIPTIYAVQISLPTVANGDTGSLRLWMEPDSTEFGKTLVNNMAEQGSADATRDAAIAIVEETVTPEKPTLIPSTECDVKATIELPDVEGIDYTTTPRTEGSKSYIDVTATLQEGYRFPPGTTADDWKWTFDVTPEKCPTYVTPKTPTLVPDKDCGVPATIDLPKQDGVEWVSAKQGYHVTVTATPKDGAIFAGGVQTVWDFDITPEDCPTEVTPEKPTLSKPDCGVEPEVTIPVVEGVTYTQERVGNTLKVTATADEGYVIPADAQYVWTFDMTVEACPPEITKVTPVEPLLLPSTRCDLEPMVIIPTSNLVKYTEKRVGDTVTVTATPIGDLVEFPEGAVTEWTFDVTATPCPAPTEVIPLAPVMEDADCDVEHQVSIPTVEGVEYTSERDGNTITVTATAKAGYVLKPSVQTEWIFDVTATACTPPTVVTPVAPELQAATECGLEPIIIIPETDLVDYTEIRVGDTVTVTAEPANDDVVFPGDAVTEWTFNVAAKPCPAEFVVQFDVNGGSNQESFPDITVAEGESVTVYADAPTRTGYKFLGWLPKALTRDAALVQGRRVHADFRHGVHRPVGSERNHAPDRADRTADWTHRTGNPRGR